MDPVGRGVPPSPNNGGEGPGFLSSLATRVARVFSWAIEQLSSPKETVVGMPSEKKTPQNIIREWVDTSPSDKRAAYEEAQTRILQFLRS